MWQNFEDSQGQTTYRAVLNGYLVFLEPHDGRWLIRVLMPEDERQKTFFPPGGFKRAVPLEEAREIARQVTGQARARLERKHKKLERKIEK